MSGNEWQLDVEAVVEEPTPLPPLADGPTPPPQPVSAPPTRGTEESPPPSPLQIVEAMLFVGGPPLTAAKAGSAVRGLTPERFRELVDELAKKYRAQSRPYAVQPRDDGFVLALRPQFRGVRDRLVGGPREARLSGPAVEVLSLIAYRQPLSKSDVDSLRGADSGGVLRQLVRLGLIAVAARGTADDPAVRYATTARFLSLFGLGSLDDLPRLGEG
jgi:segregation and condensation protein B